MRLLLKTKPGFDATGFVFCTTICKNKKTIRDVS